MHALWDSVEFGIIVIDAQGVLTHCNRWVRRHARFLADPLGATLAGAFGADLNPRLGAAIEQALRQGHSSRLSSALHPSPLALFVEGEDGVRMRHAVDVMSLAEGDHHICVLQIRDMSESYRREALLRRQAQQLQHSEQRLAATLANAPIGMALSTMEGRWTYVNRALCDILGHSAEQLVDSSTSHHVLSLPGETPIPLEQSLQEGKSNCQIEQRWRHHSGAAVWVRITATRVSDAASSTPYFILQIESIDERKRREAELTEALDEKETLLREVYHRVKNNLQVIQSLLSLKRNSVHDDNARAALAETAQRVRSMALVHEKLYQSQQLSVVDLADYLRDLVEQLKEALGSRLRAVQVTVQASSVQADLNTAIPFGLVVTELVSNSLKHAFPGERAGTLQVTLQREAEGAVLTVVDDGVGFAAGVDPRQRQSLGLKLVDSLVRQLDGEFNIHNAQGVQFTLRLPRLMRRADTA